MVLRYKFSRYVLIHFGGFVYFGGFCLWLVKVIPSEEELTIRILITERISSLRSFTWDHTYHNLTTLRFCYMDRMLFHDKNNKNIVVKWTLEAYLYVCVMSIPQFNVKNTKTKNKQTNKHTNQQTNNQTNKQTNKADFCSSPNLKSLQEECPISVLWMSLFHWYVHFFIFPATGFERRTVM